jgi:hypothetical protein
MRHMWKAANSGGDGSSEFRRFVNDHVRLPSIDDIDERFDKSLSPVREGRCAMAPFVCSREGRPRRAPAIPLAGHPLASQAINDDDGETRTRHR